MNDEGVIRTTEIDQKQARKFLKIGIDFIGKELAGTEE